MNNIVLSTLLLAVMGLAGCGGEGGEGSENPIGSATGQTDIVNVSETGKLISLAVEITGTVSGSPVSNVEIQIDGQTQDVIPAYTGASNQRWSKDGVAQFKEDDLLSGDDAGERFKINFNGIRYNTSLRVSHDISTAGATGTWSIGVWRAVKI